MSRTPLFLLEALQFQNARRERLGSASDEEWNRILSDWKYVRLTLPVREVAGEELPEWVRERIDQFLEDNGKRFERMKPEYARVAETLATGGVEHVVLKGFTLFPGYTSHPKNRPQSDIDLYCPPGMIAKAREILLELGYSMNSHWRRISEEHLSALVPANSWKWKGDHFDPDIPISLELHLTMWNEKGSRLRAEGVEEFWSRRVNRELDGLAFPGLDAVDNLGYTSLNILRGTLQSSPTIDQVYGIGRFLDRSAEDAEFWEKWREFHHESLRRLEATAFYLAKVWFACRLSRQAQEEIDRLPKGVHEFFGNFSKGGPGAEFSWRKEGLWLHLALLDSKAEKSAMLAHYLLPKTFPTADHPVGDASAIESARIKASPVRTEKKPVAYFLWILGSIFYRLMLAPARLSYGLFYKLSGKNLGRPFWTFFAASFCFDLGMTMYFFLYNIYLLDLGLKENFLGLMMSAMNIGTIACTIPAAVLIQRLGIRKSLLICISLVTLASAARAIFEPKAAIMGLALLGGFFTTIWAVAISPAIAQLTNEESRPFGFSLVFASGIGVGVIANLAASRLPGMFIGIVPTLSSIQAKQAVLLLASAIVALALIPLSRLRIDARPSAEQKIYPSNPFLLRFLPALALWSLVTGSLSPLANVYFAQYLHTPLEKLGVIFSFSNLMQVLGILVAPFLFKKLGLVPGIACTQLAVALLLGFLAATSGAVPAAMIYVGYSGFLWMSEPGMFSLLMSGVEPSERAGASAMQFLVISLVQAGAVAATGASFTRFGYPAVLGAMGALALLAAISFWALLGRNSESTTKSMAEVIDA